MPGPLRNLVLLFSLAVAAPASGTLLLGEAAFVADGFETTAGTAQPPERLVVGSFSFVYDDAITFPGSGQLAVTPTQAFARVGTHVFDETNTEVRLFFARGRLQQLFWGGLAGGAAHVIPIGEDDLSVGFFNGNPLSVSYTVAGSDGRFQSRAPFFAGQLTLVPAPPSAAVPEPGAALLLTVGFLVVRRCRSR